MEKILLRNEFIKLGQALKAAGFVETGAASKEVILNGHVKVNGKVEIQRGKKLYENDTIEYKGMQLKILK